jgi:hypothetical protein
VNFDAWMGDALFFSSYVTANKIVLTEPMRLTAASMDDCMSPLPSP